MTYCRGCRATESLPPSRRGMRSLQTSTICIIWLYARSRELFWAVRVKQASNSIGVQRGIDHASATHSAFAEREDRRSSGSKLSGRPTRVTRFFNEVYFFQSHFFPVAFFLEIVSAPRQSGRSSLQRDRTRDSPRVHQLYRIAAGLMPGLRERRECDDSFI